MLNVDLRLWHPMSFRTLTEAPWNLAAGLFRCANGPRHAALLGLHDGHIWQGIQQLTAAASFSAQNAMMIHLVFAQALCSQGISDHYVHHLRLQYANSSGMIICIFEVDWHWTLLTGCQCSNKLHWQHNDGFISAAFPGARQLAATCSHLVGLDFTMPTQHRHISQLDPHTHTHTHTRGTIALGHLFLVLNPGFMVQGHSIAPLHAWIWEPLHCLDLGASLSPLQHLRHGHDFAVHRPVRQVERAAQRSRSTRGQAWGASESGPAKTWCPNDHCSICGEEQLGSAQNPGKQTWHCPQTGSTWWTGASCWADSDRNVWRRHLQPQSQKESGQRTTSSTSTWPSQLLLFYVLVISKNQMGTMSRKSALPQSKRKPME